MNYIIKLGKSIISPGHLTLKKTQLLIRGFINYILLRCPKIPSLHKKSSMLLWVTNGPYLFF